MTFPHLGTTATDAAAHGLLAHLGLSITPSLPAAWWLNACTALEGRAFMWPQPELRYSPVKVVLFPLHSRLAFFPVAHTEQPRPHHGPRASRRRVYGQAEPAYR
jgi:hypothetical protein